MAFIPGWDIICRICLKEGTLRSLFQRDGSNLDYRNKLMRCTRLAIYENDNLPSNICVECIKELDVAYQFTVNCENTDTILRSYRSKPDIVSGNSEYELDSEDKPHIENGKEVATSPVLYAYKPPTGQDVKIFSKDKTTSLAGREIFIYKKACREQQPVEYVEDAVIDEDSIDKHSLITVDNELSEEIFEEEQSSDEVPKYFLDSSMICLDPESNDCTSRPEDNWGFLLEEIIEGDSAYVQPEGALTAEQPIKENGSFADCTASDGRTKTLQTISKSNVPNEKMPTIETVFTKSGTDGKLETVIRLKRNLKDTDAQLHYCMICNSSYKYKHSLETHLRRHRGDKPFKCEHCGKAFVVPFELQRHIRTHTGQKPYKCKYCERNFSDFGSKIKHERTHTGEKPYGCSVCGKYFAYSHVLSSHMLIHNGIKKFLCTTCGKRFTKSHHLKAHMNTHPHTQRILRGEEEMLHSNEIVHQSDVSHEPDDGVPEITSYGRMIHFTDFIKSEPLHMIHGDGVTGDVLLEAVMASSQAIELSDADYVNIING